MKRITVTEDLDVCITIETKVLFKKPASGDLAQELLRQDTILRAQYAARSMEEEVAAKVRAHLQADLDACQNKSET
jgi:hypothetical protein